MIQIRHSQERGQGRFAWLDTRHSFSFADYYDPKYMGFRSLRVINQDLVAPNSGFPLHPHRDMEIISLVLEGQLQHRDSMGNEGIVRAGEVQRISAGSGIRHSEWNPSPDQPVHFLQIWLEPQTKGLMPSYQMRTPALGEDRSPWVLLAARDGCDGAVRLNQDVKLWRAKLVPGEKNFELATGRHAWLQMISGQLEVNGTLLKSGDGLAASEEPALTLKISDGADLLLFDLA